MKTLDQDPILQEAGNQHAALQEEANRLLAYKKANIQKQDQTPCQLGLTGQVAAVLATQA